MRKRNEQNEKSNFFKKKRPEEMWATLSSFPHSHEAQQQRFKTCPLTCGNLKLPFRRINVALYYLNKNQQANGHLLQSTPIDTPNNLTQKGND